MRKVCKVVFLNDELQKEYDSLKNTDMIKKSIQRAVENIRQNAFAGIAIPKYLIPKEYNKLNLSNLWKYDLVKGWRMLYSVTSDNEIEVLAVILEWFDHKDYERRMRY